MRREHKAIIDRANREGLKPSQLASELLGHDLLETMLSQMKGHAVAFRNLSEMQQDAAIQEMKQALDEAVDNAVDIISAQATRTVRATVKKAAIGGTPTFTLSVDPLQEHLHDLYNKAQDKSDVLILMSERDYLQALDAHQGDKDQKELPLPSEDANKPAKAPRKPKEAKKEAEPVDLPQGLVDQAREFVIKFQNATVSGLQNQLRCNHAKGVALLERLADDGVLERDGDTYKLVRAAAPEPAPADAQEDYAPEVLDELFKQAYRHVIDTQIAEEDVLAEKLGVSKKLAAQFIKQLEQDGIVSEPDADGQREVLQLPF